MRLNVMLYVHCLSYNIIGAGLSIWFCSFVFPTTTLLALLFSVFATYADHTISCFVVLIALDKDNL